MIFKQYILNLWNCDQVKPIWELRELIKKKKRLNTQSIAVIVPCL